MQAHLTRGNTPSDAQAIRAALEGEGLRPTIWSNGPGDTYPEHSHAYHKTLYCISGSITFTLPADAESVELHPGDRLEIEPGTLHSAVVGPAGVFCMEAARPTE